jgi:hypothetical protein
MTRAEEEGPIRPADKVIKHRAALLLAHRVNSRQRSTSVAFGAKRTLSTGSSRRYPKIAESG